MHRFWIVRPVFERLRVMLRACRSGEARPHPEACHRDGDSRDGVRACCGVLDGQAGRMAWPHMQQRILSSAEPAGSAAAAAPGPPFTRLRNQFRSRRRASNQALRPSGVQPMCCARRDHVLAACWPSAELSTIIWGWAVSCTSLKLRACGAALGGEGTTYRRDISDPRCRQDRSLAYHRDI